VSVEWIGSSGPPAAIRFAAAPGWTAADISQGSDGTTHLLWVNADGRMTISSMDASGNLSAVHIYGPYAGWSAISMADGPDGATWVLWRRSDGMRGLASYRSGVLDTSFRFAAQNGWASEDIAVGNDDGRPRILDVNPDGRMTISTVDSAGNLVDSSVYLNPGMTARRIAGSPDGLTRVLWNALDGSGEIWLFDVNNAFVTKHSTTPASSTGPQNYTVVLGCESRGVSFCDGRTFLGGSHCSATPDNLTIHVGDTVDWFVAEIGGRHQIQSSDGQDSLVLVGPAGYSRTFTEAGTVSYECTIGYEQWELVVGSVSRCELLEHHEGGSITVAP
jgi:hypothetical protein